MKTLAILALVFVQSFAFAQNVPAKVKEAFKSKFPQASEVEWGEQGSNFIAEFYENDFTVMGVFDASGKWISTKTSMEESMVPETVTKGVLAKHKDAYFSNTFKVENNQNQVNYEIMFGTDDASYVLLVDDSGKILKTDKEVFNEDE